MPITQFSRDFEGGNNITQGFYKERQEEGTFSLINVSVNLQALYVLRRKIFTPEIMAVETQ